MPDQDYLTELHAEGSLSVFAEGWVGETTQRFKERQSVRRKPDWIVPKEIHMPPGTYLEIGPGDCFVLRQFEALDWNCYAVEPGSWTRNKINFFERLDDLPQELRFDVIVANDVLEHLTDPLSTIRKMAESLTKNGRIYLSFPNSDSLRARLRKTNWRMVRPIGHVHYFSRKSIEILLTHNGLYIHKITNYDLISPLQKKLSRFWGYGTNYKKYIGAIRDLTITLVSEIFILGDQWRVIAIKPSTD